MSFGSWGCINSWTRVTRESHWSPTNNNDSTVDVRSLDFISPSLQCGAWQGRRRWESALWQPSFLWCSSSVWSWSADTELIWWENRKCKCSKDWKIILGHCTIHFSWWHNCHGIKQRCNYWMFDFLWFITNCWNWFMLFEPGMIICIVIKSHLKSRSFYLFFDPAWLENCERLRFKILLCQCCLLMDQIPIRMNKYKI